MPLSGERSATTMELNPALERFEVTIACAQAEQVSTQYESDRPSIEHTVRRRLKLARRKAASGHVRPDRIGITTVWGFDI